MRQKTEQETAAAGRHVQLLVDALEKARGNGGVWLNPGGHTRAKMYPGGVNVSPFNALVMGLHTDAGGYKTPKYMSFNTAKDNGLSVMKGQKGVPFIWYNWDTFVNREKPDDKISRATYNALPESVRENYRAVQKREVRTVFNLDQTTFPHKSKEEYDKMVKENAPADIEGKDMEGLKTQVSHFLLTMRENLVKVQHSGEQAEAKYDHDTDTLFIPNAKNYSSYTDFTQDVMRQVMLATGYEQRLARVSRPTPEAIRQEALISELAAGIKMAELGLPATISKANMEHIDYWKQELHENPCLIDIVERDVNKALDIVSKAERGEKIEYASKVRMDLVEKLSTPDIDSNECAILLDIIRRDGVIDPLNFRSENARDTFIDKFDLSQPVTDMQQAKAELARPDITEDEKDKAEKALDKALSDVVQRCTESMPEKWNDKSHNFFIHPEISGWVANYPTEFGLVMDSKTKIADVVLPSGANLKTGVPGPSNIDRIRHAVMKYKDASYVRFFNTDGFMGYKPDDNYFRGKDLTIQKLKGWALKEIAEMQFDDAVLKANTIVFDQAQMMKDDGGKWAMYLKAHGEEGFAILPSAKDINQFFTTIQHGDDQAVNELRSELSQKYYLIGKNRPELQFDIFGMDAPKEDVARIEKASIFRNKDGRLMLMPTITNAGRPRPREIKQSQWQRLWLAPDMAAYKKNLAAKIFADVLHPKVRLQEGEQAPARAYSVKAGQKPVQENTRERSDSEEVKTRPEIAPKAETKVESKQQETKQQEQKEQSEEKQKEEQKTEERTSLSPMLRQFLDLKRKHPDALLLFRTGDFYETYKEDAQKASDILGITLTKSSKVKDDQGKPLAMAGFPYHALDTYLPKLIRNGCRVAICDQIEPPHRQEQTAERESQDQQETPSKGMRR